MTNLLSLLLHILLRKLIICSLIKRLRVTTITFEIVLLHINNILVYYAPSTTFKTINIVEIKRPGFSECHGTCIFRGTIDIEMNVLWTRMLL